MSAMSPPSSAWSRSSWSSSWPQSFKLNGCCPCRRCGRRLRVRHPFSRSLSSSLSAIVAKSRHRHFGSRDHATTSAGVDMVKVRISLLEAMKTVNQPSFKPLMSVLYAGDTMVAAQLGAASPTAASSWIPTFNFEYARYSPGTILQIEMARWAAEQGIQRIDLGRGENQMKLCLASASFDVAIGSVDHRILHRTLTRSYYGLRNLVHASPLKKISKTAMRRVKALVGR